MNRRKNQLIKDESVYVNELLSQYEVCNYRRYILGSNVFALFIILVQSAHIHLYQDQFKHNRHDDESPDMFVKSYRILD